MCYVDKVGFGFCISQKLVGLWKAGSSPKEKWLKFRIWGRQYRVSWGRYPVKSLGTQSPSTFLLCQPQSIPHNLMAQGRAVAIPSMFQAVEWVEVEVSGMRLLS